MIYSSVVPDGIDYFPCSYGNSRNRFRGPRRRLQGDYVAVIGSTETYGKDVEVPYPALMEQMTGRVCVNFGCTNAGVDAFLGDMAVHDASARARLTLLQIMGATNNSNRFYSVHGRRNDRFVRASPSLRKLFPDVDFTEVNFTHHLLQLLRDTSESRFNIVVEELQDSWRARSRSLIANLGRPLRLICLAGRDGQGDPVPLAPYVTVAMIEELASRNVEVRHVDLGDITGFDSGDGMPPIMPPDAMLHRKIAEQLATELAA